MRKECLQAHETRLTRRLFSKETFRARKAEILGLLEEKELDEAEHEEADGNKRNQSKTLQTDQ